MSQEITILGCGSSGGVPRIGQGWGACDPRNPRNERRRCSILIERKNPATGATTIVLVDTSPDLRSQLLDAQVNRLDGIVLTHDHADHTHGIDDVRPLVITMRRQIPVYMETSTAKGMLNRFGYIFQTPVGSQYPVLCQDHRIFHDHPFEIDGPGGGIALTPFRVHHGDIDALGLRLGRCAYTPDVVAIPDESVASLRDLDLWIIDALRYTPHPSHFSLTEALGWIEKMRPARAILTNLHTDMDYETLRAALPPNVEPAFDRMRLAVDE